MSELIDKKCNGNCGCGCSSSCDSDSCDCNTDNVLGIDMSSIYDKIVIKKNKNTGQVFCDMVCSEAYCSDGYCSKNYDNTVEVMKYVVSVFNEYIDNYENGYLGSEDK